MVDLGSEEVSSAVMAVATVGWRVVICRHCQGSLDVYVYETGVVDWSCGNVRKREACSQDAA